MPRNSSKPAKTVTTLTVGQLRELENNDVDKFEKTTIPALPLAHDWTFYFDDGCYHGNKAMSFMDNLTKLGTANTVQSFWEHFNAISSNFDKEDAPDKFNLRMFKNNIKPIWEDVNNANGGQWTIRCPKDKFDTREMYSLYRDLVLAIIGEQLPGCIDVNGCVISLRSKKKEIQLWNRTPPAFLLTKTPTIYSSAPPLQDYSLRRQSSDGSSPISSPSGANTPGSRKSCNSIAFSNGLSSNNSEDGRLTSAPCRHSLFNLNSDNPDFVPFPVCSTSLPSSSRRIFSRSGDDSEPLLCHLDLSSSLSSSISSTSLRNRCETKERHKILDTITSLNKTLRVILKLPSFYEISYTKTSTIIADSNDKKKTWMQNDTNTTRLAEALNMSQLSKPTSKTDKPNSLQGMTYPAGKGSKVADEYEASLSNSKNMMKMKMEAGVEKTKSTVNSQLSADNDSHLSLLLNQLHSAFPHDDKTSLEEKCSKGWDIATRYAKQLAQELKQCLGMPKDDIATITGRWNAINEAARTMLVELLKSQRLLWSKNRELTDLQSRSYDIFLSHAGEEKAPYCSWVRDSLKKHRLSGFLDYIDIDIGDDPSLSIRYAMLKCNVGVAIISPTFVQKWNPVLELAVFASRLQHQKLLRARRLDEQLNPVTELPDLHFHIIPDAYSPKGCGFPVHESFWRLQQPHPWVDALLDFPLPWSIMPCMLAHVERLDVHHASRLVDAIVRRIEHSSATNSSVAQTSVSSCRGPARVAITISKEQGSGVCRTCHACSLSALALYAAAVSLHGIGRVTDNLCVCDIETPQYSCVGHSYLVHPDSSAAYIEIRCSQDVSALEDKVRREGLDDSLHVSFSPGSSPGSLVLLCFGHDIAEKVRMSFSDVVALHNITIDKVSSDFLLGVLIYESENDLHDMISHKFDNSNSSWRIILCDRSVKRSSVQSDQRCDIDDFVDVLNRGTMLDHLLGVNPRGAKREDMLPSTVDNILVQKGDSNTYSSLKMPKFPVMAEIHREQLKKTGWLLEKQSSEVTLVFIHGILPNGETSWYNERAKTCWPELVRQHFHQTGKEAPNMYAVNYETGFLSSGYSVSDAVDMMKENFKYDGVLESCRQLVFVCHSMGGIVARKYLVTREQDLVEANLTIGLFLVASPSLGAEYARWLCPLASFIGHSHARILAFSGENRWLSDLDKEFKNLLGDTRLVVRGKELIEDKFRLAGWYTLASSEVPAFSGVVYFPRSLQIPYNDHFSIAQPETCDDLQNKALLSFLDELRSPFPAVVEVTDYQAAYWNSIQIEEMLTVERSNQVRKEVKQLASLPQLREYSEKGDFLVAVKGLTQLREGIALYGNSMPSFAIAWALRLKCEKTNALQSEKPAEAINRLRRCYLNFWYRVVDCVDAKLITVAEAGSLHNCDLLPLCAEFDRAHALILIDSHDLKVGGVGMHWYAKVHVDQHLELDTAFREGGYAGYHSGNPLGMAPMNRRLLWLQAHHPSLLQSLIHPLMPTFLVWMKGCPENVEDSGLSEDEQLLAFVLAPRFNTIDLDSWLALHEKLGKNLESAIELPIEEQYMEVPERFASLATMINCCGLTFREKNRSHEEIDEVVEAMNTNHLIPQGLQASCLSECMKRLCSIVEKGQSAMKFNKREILVVESELLDVYDTLFLQYFALGLDMKRYILQHLVHYKSLKFYLEMKNWVKFHAELTSFQIDMFVIEQADKLLNFLAACTNFITKVDTRVRLVKEEKRCADLASAAYAVAFSAVVILGAGCTVYLANVSSSEALIVLGLGEELVATLDVGARFFDPDTLSRSLELLRTMTKVITLQKHQIVERFDRDLIEMKQISEECENYTATSRGSRLKSITSATEFLASFNVLLSKLLLNNDSEAVDVIDSYIDREIAQNLDAAPDHLAVAPDHLSAYDSDTSSTASTVSVH